MPQILVRKTIQIKKEPHKIIPYIGDFHQWIKWSPWLILDPKASIKVDASGYPYRTQITGTLLFGYSDHYPVYIVIGKE